MTYTSKRTSAVRIKLDFVLNASTNKGFAVRFLIVFLMIVWSSTASASEWQSNSKLEAVFAASNVIGTFVLYDTDVDTLVGYNQKRARTRYIPASTYKIPNTLIGLTVGAVKSVDENFPYDGKPQPVKSWERDMGLREAIKVSNVPVYQELARKIGLERMRAELARLDYGNSEVGAVVDRFWLEGPLVISPVEQALFLARLAQRKLPLPEKAQMQTRELLFVEQNADWSLFAKTGTVTRLSPNIGWWVGWVEKEGKIYSFALNIELPQSAAAWDRIQLGKQCLAALGVIRVLKRT